MRELLIADSAGIYIPRNFYEYYDLKSWGLDPAEYSSLSDPENDQYWDAWEDLLRDAVHTDKDGHDWVLEQDGDLWAVRADFQGFEPIDDSELDQRFKDWLDEAYEPVSIVGLEYRTSMALKAVDEIAYREAYNNWLDAEIRDNSIKEWNGLYWVQS